MKDNDFLIKFKGLPLDTLNDSMSQELKIFEKYCNKKVVIWLFNGGVYEGKLTGYDMFQLHLERNGELEKFLLSDVDKIKEI